MKGTKKKKKKKKKKNSIKLWKKFKNKNFQVMKTIKESIMKQKEMKFLMKKK